MTPKRLTSGSGSKPVRGRRKKAPPESDEPSASLVVTARDEGKSTVSADDSEPAEGKSDAAAGEAITQKEFAKRIERSPRQVRNLTDLGVVTRNPDGTYPWPEVFEQWVAYKQTERERRYEGKGLDLEEQQARHTAAKAELAELDLAQKRGELVHIRDVAAMVSKPLEQVDAALRNAPSRHASRLAKLVGVTTPVAMRALEEIMEATRTDLRMIRNADSDVA